jgi:hypothetical protein
LRKATFDLVGRPTVRGIDVPDGKSLVTYPTTTRAREEEEVYRSQLIQPDRETIPDYPLKGIISPVDIAKKHLVFRHRGLTPVGYWVRIKLS